MVDPLFKKFCENDEGISVGELLDTYASAFNAPFFSVEEQGPFIADDELRQWLGWCLFYGKPRDEYVRPARTGMILLVVAFEASLMRGCQRS
ncbi:hypothetical protein CSQ85_05150 [Bifidobacterium rousetti]|uniref:hypothetical protein n=1 Tax=Bifidobacterium rousetti TaxID=2045439 RepID=UPI000D142FCD|nr:hypothetical protein [Bifidobacterium rousetti]KAA8819408.1 hypothetical protein CSQ85_05150 [Bifidobacterium rousetti]PST49034.1 hypothetical protein COO72_04950 [Bifidobacterium callitrichos]